MRRLNRLDLPALRAAQGSVHLPGSKSISNRVLLLAGLSEGTTVLHSLLQSDDTEVMLTALTQLGCVVDGSEPGVTRITGLGGQLKTTEAELFLGNAGTAMRPLAAALALLSALQGGRFTLRGVPRMHERPIADLVDALRQFGCEVQDLGQPGYPPLCVHGPSRDGLRTTQPLPVRGDVSSQFLTALLMALPLASADNDITIEVVGELISRPYIEITLNLLQRFGIDVRRVGFERFVIPQGSRFRSPGQLHVEADASSASYFIALGAIAALDAPLHIEGVGLDSIQGDIRFVEAARAMGAHIVGSAGSLMVRRGAWPLRAIRMDCTEMPDAAMTLAMMALYAEGTSRLDGVGSWRVKETDRIAAMTCELSKLGAKVTEGPDFIEINAPDVWHSATLQTYDDHRMAMCLSLAAFNPLASHDNAQGAGVSIRLLDPGCVAKTYPGYFDALFAVAGVDAAQIPVITIDGPTASGKGTLAARLAERLGWHQLDSGLLYRATAFEALRQSVALDDEPGLSRLAAALPLRFEGEQVWLADEDVSLALRHEDVGVMASRVSAWPAVRQALHALQLGFRRLPGLVADGRDMGTVVFPDAALKVYLTASAAQRALRRHKQLISKGIPSNIDNLRRELEARDVRDKSRAVSPLKPADDAQLLDNSELSIDQSVDQVLGWWQKRSPRA